MTTKEKLESIVKYVKDNPDPDQNVCPELIQTWRNVNGRVYWSNKTGERTYGSNGKASISVKNFYFGTYIKYIDDLDALEISYIGINGNRGVDGVKKDWNFRTYNERYFIFHNDVNVYVGSGNCRIIYTNQRYYNKEMLYRLGTSPDIFDHTIASREIKKFDPDFDNTIYSYGYLYSIRCWYEKAFIKRNKSKKASDLSSYEFDNIDDQIEFDEHNRYYSYTGYFQLVDENYAVIRIFNQSYGGEASEKYRVFISKNGKPSILEYSYREWKVKAQISTYASVKIQNIDDMEEWKPLKYILPCLREKDNQGGLMISILRHPIIEKLMKSGYPHIAQKLYQDNKIPSNLTDYFSVSKETNKPLFRELGVSKYLLDKYENYMSATRYSYTRPIREIKRLYETDDISGLSKETIDLLFDVFKDSNTTINSVLGDGRYYYYDDEVRINEEKRNFFIRLCKMNERSRSDVIRTYVDVKRLARGLVTMPDIDINNFHNEEDLIRIHDAVVNLNNLEQEERRARYDEYQKKRLEAREAQFKKLQKERIEKYEKDGDKYCIRMPKTLAEIVTEGTVLCHCVGGYAESHANGNTNIIFLREKDRETIPFYTIEIRDGRVIQIHGKHNRWLGNDPSAIPFVYEWLKGLDVSFDKKMLLNTGAGYCQGRETLPESYLYAS